MIKEASIDDLNIINELISELNQKIDSDYFNFAFNKAYIFEEKGVLLFKKIEDFVEIDYIVVKEESRKQMIGRKLLEYLIESIKDGNICSIFLEVNIKNEDAINFYKQNGFTLVSLRKNYYNRKEDALILERRI